MKAAQKDFYKILGVMSSAELAVIKAAYKALIMIYHPDRYKGDKKEALKKSTDINEAYAVLTDPDKRKKYDAQRLKKPEHKSEASEIELKNVLNEVKKALEDSKAILDILNEPL
ncbi:MAG: DnaJ domain-containing protein [Methylobacter sp.]